MCAFTPNASWITRTAPRVSPWGSAWKQAIGPSAVSSRRSLVCTSVMTRSVGRLRRTMPGHAARADRTGARMEFGIFIQGHLPGPRAHDSEAEHRMLLDEVELVKCADRNNW